MTNYNKEEAEILRRESERTSKYPIDYSMYDTSLEGYVVIPVKPKENEEAILTELGYGKETIDKWMEEGIVIEKREPSDLGGC